MQACNWALPDLARPRRSQARSGEAWARPRLDAKCIGTRTKQGEVGACAASLEFQGAAGVKRQPLDKPRGLNFFFGRHPLPFRQVALETPEWTSRDSNHHRQSVSAGKTNAIPTDNQRKLGCQNFRVTDK